MSSQRKTNNSKRDVAKPRRNRKQCVHFHDGPNGNSCGYHFCDFTGLLIHVDCDCIGPSQCGMYQERKPDAGEEVAP